MPAALAGERIRTLRNLLDISQAQLAASADVSQGLISQVESGVKPATAELVDAVAESTGTPRSFFDVDPPNLPPGTLRWRRLATARRTDTRRLEALLGETWRIAAGLLDSAGMAAPDLPALSGDVRTDDIEAVAAETREALDVGGDGPLKHVTRILERARIVVAPLLLPGDHADGADEAKTVGHFGASLWPSTEEHALIGYFPADQGDRQRFTIAHELGHLVLHTRRRSVTDPEDEAHRFAGAFLAPANRMREAFDRPVTLTDLAQLKARWGVSMQALIMRGSALGLIDEHRKTSLYKQLSARRWRTREPVDVPPEQPVLLHRLLVARFGDQSWQHWGEDVGMAPLVLRTLAPKEVRT